MLTFGQIRNSGRVRRIASSCKDSDDFASITNDAVRELMKRGSFWNTVKRITACVYSGCIVFPRSVGTLLALDRCGNSIPPKNHWYSFNSVLPSDIRNYGFGQAWDGRVRGGVAIEDIGTVSVFNQAPCLNDRYIQYYPTRGEDAGKVITIFGIDSNGQVIRSTHADGIYQDGIELTLALPYVQSPMLVRRVDRVIKDITQGTVYGYWFDGANRYDLSVYEPSEVLPEYRNTRIQGCWNGPNYCGPSQITGMVKMAFIEMRYDDDLCPIDNPDAIALAIQSIKKSDAYESADAEVMMMRAVKNLNLQLRDLMPNDSIPTQCRVFGNASLENRAIGRLI